MTITTENTVKEAKAFLRANYQSGVECPCCGQFVKQYKRKFNAGMALSLIILYKMNKETPGRWVHIQNEFAGMKILATGIDYSQLKRWGFIEPKPLDERADGFWSSGYWRITQQGIDFATSKTTILPIAMIYDNKTQGFSGDAITISQALGKKFNYAELMDRDSYWQVKE